MVTVPQVVRMVMLETHVVKVSITEEYLGRGVYLWPEQRMVSNV